MDDDYIPTHKQMDILELVYKFRFINRKQIQKIFDYKDPRSVNPLLKDLVEHKYLNRIYSHKLLENTKPAIYYLANEGIGWVRANYYEDEPEKVKRFYQDKHASERFINHCVALCDLFIQWQGSKNEYPIEGYYFSTSTELWSEEELRKIRPDAHIEIWKDEIISTFFLDLIESYVPMYAIRYKTDQYINFRSNSDRWDIYSCDDFKSIIIRLIFSNQIKQRRMSRYIKEQLSNSFDVEDLTFLLTTHKRVLEEGVNADIWEIVNKG